MNWQSMFKENKEFTQYLGFIKKVFDDMCRKSKIVKCGKTPSDNFILFQVKLLEMKYFIDSAKQHVSLAIQKQFQDLQNDSETVKDRQ